MKSQVFNRTVNPHNCGMLVLERQRPDALGREHYRLTRESLRILGLAGPGCGGRANGHDVGRRRSTDDEQADMRLSNDACDEDSLSAVPRGGGRRRSISDDSASHGAHSGGEQSPRSPGGGGGHGGVGGKVQSAHKRRSWAAPPNMRDSPVDELIQEYAYAAGK
jgi:hypothetical protein